MRQSCRLVRSQNPIPSSGSKPAISERIGMEEPVADDACARGERRERVGHHVVRMEREEGAGKIA